MVLSVRDEVGNYHENKIDWTELFEKRKRLRERTRELKSQITRRRNNWAKKHSELQAPAHIQRKERDLESVWRKVRRLDREISHQVASETVWFCEHHNVKTIYFEDLRFFQGKGGMRTHSWNLSMNLWGQIIDGVRYRRSTLGHYKGGVWTVNPFMTSQKCHQCGVKGVRVETPDSKEEKTGGEFFYCAQCGLQMHADVNAARNIIDVQSPRPCAVSGRTGSTGPTLSKFQ